MSEITLSQSSWTRVSATPEYPAALRSIAVLVLTSVHHAYGAVIYDTPWRMYVVFFSAPAAMLIAGLFYLGWKHRYRKLGRAATWTGIAVAVVFPIGMIGMFEGAYNHVLKNIHYFGGASNAVFSWLFPAPAYEIPNDLIFEATGIAQFVVAMMAAIAVAAAIRGRLA
jgi:hypothetical protein